MKVTALLPMKAHSSRVPGKNFKIIAGKPLYAWMLGTLLECDFVDKVVINTDARRELDATGLEDSPRVQIHERPPELCGDDVSMNRIIEHDLRLHPADCYLMTHTTSPAITTATLSVAYERYQSGVREGFDSLFTVNRFQTRFYRHDGSPVNHDPENLIPTQDLEPWYEENSCFYFFSNTSFAATQARIGRRPILFETPKMESLDIDEQEDWDLASKVLGA